MIAGQIFTKMLCFRPVLVLLQVLFAVQEENIYSTCVLRTYDFLSIFAVYFRDVNLIAFEILETNNPGHDLNYFADKIGGLVARRRPVLWKSNYLEIYQNFSGYAPSFAPPKQHRVRHERGTFKNSTAKLKMYSRDKEHGYVFIVWNEESLHKFLDEDPMGVTVKSRGIYLVLLVEGAVETLSTLPRFWLEFGVYNVLATTLCDSRNPKNIFVYDPFHFENATWGMVNSFTVGEVLEDPNAIFDFMDDFNGFPVRISIFSRPPTLMTKIPKPLLDNNIYKILKERSNGFGGIDGCFVAFLSEKLNFSCVISEPNDANYGLVFQDTVTGSLGEVISKLVDISANGRFLIDYGVDGYEFTTPVSDSLLCPVVPKSERIPQWRMIFHGFTKDTWIFMLGVVILCSCFWYLVGPYNFCAASKKKRSFARACLEITGVIFNAPIKLPKRLGQRIFIASLLALNVIMVGIFQGTLVQSFSTISYYPDINTLKQLHHSGLPIATSLQVFQSDANDLMKKLQKKIVSINTNALRRAAFHRDVAAMERKQDAYFLIRSKFMKNGMPLLHIVNECASSLFIAYIVPKNSPFLPKFNSVILNFFESGLFTKWYEDFVEAIILEQHYIHERTINYEKPFTISDIQAAFYVLVFGYFCSSVAFICEIFLSKKS